jgi:AcrR family transcriptional regulator
VSEDSLRCTVPAVTSPPRRAAALPPEERRAALVAATLPLVLEHGTEIPTRLIAEAAGVAEGTIFRVFPTKEELIQAVVASAFDTSPLVEAIDHVDRELPLADRLEAAVELMQAHGRRLSGLMHAFAVRGTLRPHTEGDQSLHRSERARHMRAAEARVIDALVVLIDPDRDQLRCPPTEAARRLRLVSTALSHPRFVEGDALPPGEVVSLLLDGLRARADDSPHPATSSSIGAPAC